MAYDIDKFVESIRKAVKVAQQFEDADDGGTCNFDSAYLVVPGMRESQAMKIERLAGIHLSLHTYRMHGRILQIIGGLSGQGARRSKMAETMRKSLAEDGLNAGMWYQMD